MKPSVILYKKLPDDLEQRLDALFTVTRVPNLSEETVQQHAAEFAQAAGLLGAGGKVDAALLDKMPALRVASTVSVGYDNFDVDALTARKVVLMHTPTVLTETVADTLMALVLSTARRVVEVAERVKAGEWQKSIGPDWYGTDVHHKTIGIVGMGRIGMALAQRAHAGFGMPVLYNARRHHTEAEERFGAPLLRAGRPAGGSRFRLSDPAPDRRNPPPVRRGAVQKDEVFRHLYQRRARSGGGRRGAD
ncbi:Glyoxylate/hydroxypyruvate reductase B [Pluralibacter gergoviae]|nr:Glyoxylate/hydroxypyruvate reductase B [Pluralibacter gergoviae]